MYVSTADLIEPLGAFALGFPSESIPPEVVDHAADLLLDALAVGMAGRRADGVDSLISGLQRRASGAGTILIGRSDRLPAPEAAPANGAAIHAIQYDPGYDRSLFHPMSGIVPAALAVAEEQGGLAGKELLAAIVVSAEMVCRIADAALELSPIYRCFPMGAFGAVAIAARIGRFSESVTQHAFGIALAQGASPWQPHSEGAACHGPLPGFGARAGLLAATLAETGLTGPRRVLEGERGYYQTFERGAWDRNLALDGLGEEWRVLDIGLKPFPAGRLTHGAISAVLSLRERHRIEARQVERIVVESGAVVTARTGRVPDPAASVVVQRLSVPFAVAQALIHGRVGLAEFGEGRAADLEVQRLVRRTETRVAADIPAGAICPVRVAITLAGGVEHTIQIDALLGNRDLPLTRDQRLNKVRNCWSVGQPEHPDGAETLIRAIADLSTAMSADSLLRAIVSPRTDLPGIG